MVVTERIIEQKYREYDKAYFNDELPIPRFGLLKSYTTCGYFSCRKIIGKRRVKGPLLEISVYYDWKEEDLKNVIVHEMIHYYLAYKHIDNGLTHGDAFKEMASDFNTKYDLNITEMVDCSGFKKTDNAPRLSWFLTQIFY